MWTKIDDQFYLNPKNANIDRDEQDLYMAGIVYCNGQLTDGFIPCGVLVMLCIWAKIELDANPQAIAQAIASRLVEHKYWEFADNGYMVHDFLEWNPSKAEVLALKEARSAAGRRGGQISAKIQANAQANAQAKSKQSSTPSPSPSPSPSLNKEKSGASAPGGKPARTPKPRDERLDHPAIIAYRDEARLQVPIQLRDEVIACVSDPVLWKHIIHDWIARGWNKQNISGLLEAYRAGGIGGKPSTPTVKMRTLTDPRGNVIQVPA